MVIPNIGKLWLLNQALKIRAAIITTYRVMLFKNNETVTDDSVNGDFVIADFDGYEDVTFDNTEWDDAVEAANLGISVLLSDPTYDCTGGAPQTVYGWIMIDDFTGELICGQNFDVPRVMTSGSRETLTPFRIECKTFA